MKKLVLIDGNNLMFRSYYATAYTGNIMKNSKGLPTNALYGFANMINKIVAEENPIYIAVAFDIGKNFRKAKYDFYKEGRNATPEELKIQMPIARKILDGMGIKYLEKEPYEADDIIGTLVHQAELDPDFDVTIISSDKDLLQLINFETDIKLLKQDSYIRYNERTFKEEWKIDPIKIIDLKGLMGDASDNIPGVKGVGEKTALKLLQEYGSVENIYENIDNIKGALKQKLLDGKDSAFMSKEIATIYKEVPLDVDFESLKYLKTQPQLKDIYQDLEFYSLLSKMEVKKETKLDYKKVSVNDLKLEKEIALFTFLDQENYHYAKVLGCAIKDKNNIFFLNDITGLNEILKDKTVITYDYKKELSHLDFNSDFDLMISAYLLNKNVKDDIASLMNIDGVSSLSYASIKKNKFEINSVIDYCIQAVDYLYNSKEKYQKALADQGLTKLFNEIEMPLSKVLSEVEKSGMVCKRDILDKMKIETNKQLEDLKTKIYELAGKEFNISSPRQLGEVLFEHLNLPGGKKNKTGYKTDASVLEKLLGKHPVIEPILIYRNLSKISSTYIEGLEQYIADGEIIHPIFKQTLARTGRLSCTEPNLQNIPTKDEYGKLIRKAFVPKNDLFISFDYSQIELRLLAHISNDKRLIEAFNNGEDIHTHVAADIYGIEEKDVTKLQRKTAKAVIFGIVYGISGFGLGENLHITPKEAKMFIEKYYELYPDVKNYMDNIIKQAKKDGYVKTLFGRIRVIEELNSSNYMVRQSGERMALNTPIQGTSADIIKLAMVRIENKLKKHNLKSKLVLQIHDELIFDVVNEEKEQIIKLAQEEMENVIKLSVPLKVSKSCATNWYEV